jgi:hypothetical protein
MCDRESHFEITRLYGFNWHVGTNSHTTLSESLQEIESGHRVIALRDAWPSHSKAASHFGGLVYWDASDAGRSLQWSQLSGSQCNTRTTASIIHRQTEYAHDFGVEGCYCSPSSKRIMTCLLSAGYQRKDMYLILCVFPTVIEKGSEVCDNATLSLRPPVCLPKFSSQVLYEDHSRTAGLIFK